MDKVSSVLSKFGLSDKEIEVYLTLLSLGPAPVRKIAIESGVNRGTTYDILKSLQSAGLVSYYHKAKHQYFVAEDPKKLLDAFRARLDKFEALKKEITEVLPELRLLHAAVEDRPVVTYYYGAVGVRLILQDVLDQVELEDIKEYYVYSSATIRQYLYAAFPDFSESRVVKKINVKVIALGRGGELVGLDERKWLSDKQSAPTYTLIYAGRVAMISTNKEGMPVGVIIQNRGLYETQKIIFTNLWKLIN